MSATIVRSEEWIGASKGLMGKIKLPSNLIALRADIATVTYSVKLMGSANPPVTGNLDPAIVMLVATAPWNRDPEGHSFLWEAPGSLWPDPGTYRVTVTFTTTVLLGSKPIIELWEIEAKDPDV